MNALRKSRPSDMSQRELAHQSGVEQAVISRLESFQTENPRLDTMLKILGVYGKTLKVVSVDEDDVLKHHS
jgi:predicted transcriptional regulator